MEYKVKALECREVGAGRHEDSEQQTLDGACGAILSAAAIKMNLNLNYLASKLIRNERIRVKRRRLSCTRN
jgi:hypothetical protein